MSDLSARDRAFILRFPEVFGPVDQLQPLIGYQGLAVGDGWMPCSIGFAPISRQ